MSAIPSSAREQIFSQLFQATAEKYQKSRRDDPGLIDAEGKAFLASIGYAEQEFLDFIEDYVGVSGEALDWYRLAAEKGDVSAQAGMGRLYANGTDVSRDYAQAVYWYLKAAEKGDITAQESLGYLFANGLGVEQDYAQAAHWYRKAAEQGSAYAQLYLAYQLQHGQGISKNTDEAIRWFRKAAEQGDAKAREELEKLGVVG